MSVENEKEMDGGKYFLKEKERLILINGGVFF